MSDLHDLVQADIDSFALAVNSKPYNLFFYKTPHTLEDVLHPGYFNPVFETSVRRHDRIEVVASCNGAGEFATLAVDKVVSNGGIRSVEVSLLQRYGR